MESVLPQVITASAAVVGTVGGYILAGWNDARRDARGRALAREQRSADEEAHRVGERHKHQLETLAALQEDMQRVARNAGRILAFDHQQARKGLVSLLPEGWSEGELEDRMRMRRHASQVLDGTVRAAAERLSEVTARLSMSAAPLRGLGGDELERAVAERMLELSDAAVSAQDAAGAALRGELLWSPPASAAAPKR